jgi:hypothetical protein
MEGIRRAQGARMAKRTALYCSQWNWLHPLLLPFSDRLPKIFLSFLSVSHSYLRVGERGWERSDWQQKQNSLVFFSAYFSAVLEIFSWDLSCQLSCHVLYAWFPSDCHVIAMWLPSGCQWLPTGCQVFAEQLLGCCQVVAKWLPSSFQVVTMWLLSGHQVVAKQRGC